MLTEKQIFPNYKFYTLSTGSYLGYENKPKYQVCVHSPTCVTTLCSPACASILCLPVCVTTLCSPACASILCPPVCATTLCSPAYITNHKNRFSKSQCLRLLYWPMSVTLQALL